MQFSSLYFQVMAMLQPTNHSHSSARSSSAWRQVSAHRTGCGGADPSAERDAGAAPAGERPIYRSYLVTGGLGLFEAAGEEPLLHEAARGRLPGPEALPLATHRYEPVPFSLKAREAGRALELQLSPLGKDSSGRSPKRPPCDLSQLLCGCQDRR